MKRGKLTLGFALAAIIAMLPSVALAAEDITVADLAYGLDNLFVFLVGTLIIFMQAGFAMLEAGAVRMKNAGHIAVKQIVSLSVISIAFWAFGFAITFGNDNGSGLFGTVGWFLNVADDKVNEVFSSLGWMNASLGAKYLMQMAFAAVSFAVAMGGLAERAKLSVYIIGAFLFTTIIYPVVGHWVWGGGWLGQLGAQDYAGSIVVHLEGGVFALIATLLLGPRIGRFNKNGTPNVLPAHNQVYSVIGVLILWFGWFGFNPGSAGTALGGFNGYVALTTNLGAAAGALGAMFIAWIVLGKAEVGHTLNGALAALVTITGATAFVEPWAAIVISALSGIITFFTSMWLEKKGVDDPLCAISVHGVAGVWGAVATGLFASPRLVEITGIGKPGLFYGAGFDQLIVQVLAVIGTIGYVAVVSFVILYVLKKTIGLRITEEQEIAGLDISEHGAYGYPEHLDPELKKKVIS